MSSSPPRRLTVLQVIPSLETGGAERTTLDIAAALVAGGDRALVASSGGRMEPELAALGAEFVRMPAQAKNPGTLLANAWRLARLARRERVDIIHARSRAPAWAALLACRMTGLPFVTTYHGSYGENGSLKRFYNSVMARGDLVIANSHYTARLISERYGVGAERVLVIPRGIDLDRFAPGAVESGRREALKAAWGLQDGDRMVLNLARLTGWKGQGVLVDAFASPLFRDRDGLVLVLAGDDQGRSGYRSEIERRISGHGLGGRVRLVGHCDDVPTALSIADVAVIASTEPEAFGRAAVEAQAAGVPIVATDLGAAAETVLAPPEVEAAKRTGWRVPAGDPGAMTAAIAAALDLTPVERGALAARARTHAGRFSLHVMQSATLAAYDTLIARNSPRQELT